MHIRWQTLLSCFSECLSSHQHRIVAFLSFSYVHMIVGLMQVSRSHCHVSHAPTAALLALTSSPLVQLLPLFILEKVSCGLFQPWIPGDPSWEAASGYSAPRGIIAARLYLGALFYAGFWWWGGFEPAGIYLRIPAIAIYSCLSHLCN